MELEGMENKEQLLVFKKYWKESSILGTLHQGRQGQVRCGSGGQKPQKLFCALENRIGQEVNK